MKPVNIDLIASENNILMYNNRHSNNNSNDANGLIISQLDFNNKPPQKTSTLKLRKPPKSKRRSAYRMNNETENNNKKYLLLEPTEEDLIQRKSTRYSNKLSSTITKNINGKTSNRNSPNQHKIYIEMKDTEEKNNDFFDNKNNRNFIEENKQRSSPVQSQNEILSTSINFENKTTKNNRIDIQEKNTKRFSLFQQTKHKDAKRRSEKPLYESSLMKNNEEYKSNKNQTDEMKNKKRFSSIPTYHAPWMKRKSYAPVMKTENEMELYENSVKQNIQETKEKRIFDGKTEEEFIKEDKERRESIKKKNQNESKERIITPRLNQKGNIYNTLIYFVDLHKTTFLRWTGYERYRVLYFRNYKNLRTFEFNNIVKNKNNIMIVCKTTQGNIFGCFIHKRIPKNINKKPCYIRKDNKFFVFTLKNPQFESPRRFLRKNNGDCVCFYHSYEQKLFSIKHCCEFVSQKQSMSQNDDLNEVFESHFVTSFQEKFKNKQYTNKDGHTVKADYLIFNNSETFDIDQFLVIQFENK